MEQDRNLRAYTRSVKRMRTLSFTEYAPESEKHIQKYWMEKEDVDIRKGEAKIEDLDGEYFPGGTQETVSDYAHDSEEHVSSQDNSLSSSQGIDSADEDEECSDVDATRLCGPLIGPRGSKRANSDDDSEWRSSAARRPRIDLDIVPSWLESPMGSTIQQWHKLRLKGSITPALARRMQSEVALKNPPMTMQDAQKLWNWMVDAERDGNVDWDDKVKILEQCQDEWNTF
ncbi:hypothetical protein BC835DRAFT_1415037 [Cytidiella melzeri]|nr:hypothetical protein BC835DRAFT_1415037 [Cytidiella melzeri]